jgi:hypothetical protein
MSSIFAEVPGFPNLLAYIALSDNLAIVGSLVGFIGIFSRLRRACEAVVLVLHGHSSLEKLNRRGATAVPVNPENASPKAFWLAGRDPTAPSLMVQWDKILSRAPSTSSLAGAEVSPLQALPEVLPPG